MNFPLCHIASLCKYTGISFTAGAINHGFFSVERAIPSITMPGTQIGIVTVFIAKK